MRAKEDNSKYRVEGWGQVTCQQGLERGERVRRGYLEKEKPWRPHVEPGRVAGTHESQKSSWDQVELMARRVMVVVPSTDCRRHRKKQETRQRPQKDHRQGGGMWWKRSDSRCIWGFSSQEVLTDQVWV